MQCHLKNKIFQLIGPLKDNRSFILVTLISSICYFMFGYFVTQVPSLLRQLGEGSIYIAYIATMSAIACIFVGFSLGYLPIIFKTRNLYIGILACLILSLLGFVFMPNNGLMIVMLFFFFSLFVSLSMEFTCGFVNFLAEKNHVARVEAFSHMLHTIIYGFGPIVAGLNLIPVEHMSLLMIGILVLLIIVLCRYGGLVDVREAHRAEMAVMTQNNQPKKNTPLPKIMLMAPVALVIAFLYGVIDQISDFMGPAFGKEEHFSLLERDSLLSLFTWGGGLFIIVIAILVDKLPKSQILMGYIVLCLIVSALLYFFGDVYVITAISFALLGAMTGSFGPFMSALYRTKLEGSSFVRAVSSTNILFGVGALMGPNVYTIIAQKEKLDTFFIMILGIAVILALGLLYRKREEHHSA